MKATEGAGGLAFTGGGDLELKHRDGRGLIYSAQRIWFLIFRNKRSGR